ncbi:uncharacterized protein LOC111103141 [Crassostrea virginica]
MGNSSSRSTNTQNESVQNETGTITSLQISYQRDENEDATNAGEPDDQQMVDAFEEFENMIQSFDEQYGDGINRRLSNLNVAGGNAFKIYLGIAGRVIRKGITVGVVIFLLVLAKRILMAVEKRYGVGKAVVDFINPFLHQVAKYISGKIYGKFYNHRELIARLRITITAAYDAAVPQWIE